MGRDNPIPRIVSINLGKRLALLDDGRTVPITTLMDKWGEDTDDTESAVVFVAGAGTMWFSDLLSSYESVTTQ